tara:strand:+ start:844 stop:1203 length:360 start_codon:yes stop_codon:yes gene_type:complete
MSTSISLHDIKHIGMRKKKHEGAYTNTTFIFIGKDDQLTEIILFGCDAPIEAIGDQASWDYAAMKHRQKAEAQEELLANQRWARLNYRPGSRIEEHWNKQVRDECRLMNRDIQNELRKE